MTSPIVVPSDGLPVISYIDVTNKALKLAKCSTQNCTGTTTLTPIDAGQVADGVTAITFGADTYPVMTYSVINPNRLNCWLLREKEGHQPES